MITPFVTETHRHGAIRPPAKTVRPGGARRGDVRKPLTPTTSG